MGGSLSFGTFGTMEITIADTAEQFAMIERLARRIVPEFYAPYFARTIGEYLVESGHTAVALSLQADKGYQHFLIGSEGKPVGYFSLGPNGSGSGSGAPASANGGLLLSHFYILPEYRGRGFGKLAMEFIDRRVAEMGAGRVELFVLRENVQAVRHYLRNGYVVQGEVLTRLGNGAILEDYLMRKEVVVS